MRFYFFIVVLMPLVRKRTDHAGAAIGSKRAHIAPAYPCRVCKAECSYEQLCSVRRVWGLGAHWLHTHESWPVHCLRCDHTLAVLLFAVFTRCKWPCQLPCQFEKNRQLGTRHPRMQAQAQSEMALLSFYNVTLPGISLLKMQVCIFLDCLERRSFIIS